MPRNVTTARDERVRLRETLTRLRDLANALELHLDEGSPIPLSGGAGAVLSAAGTIVATAARHDAYLMRDQD